jgi:hypothetical protein
MGWKGEGHGLGKEDQGIARPIDIDRSCNRFGLGFVYHHDDSYADELRALEQIDSIAIADLNLNSHQQSLSKQSHPNASKPNNQRQSQQQQQKQALAGKPKGIGMRDLLNNIHRLLADFIGAQSQNDLVFEKSLSKDERKLVHREASKLGLKTRSEGAGENRFLVVSKKRSTNEIIESTINGARISKYRMISKGDAN